MPRARLFIHLLVTLVILSLGSAPFAFAQDGPGTPETMSSSSAAVDTPMFRGNPAGTGEVPGTGPEGQPAVLWSREIGMTPWFGQPSPTTGEGLVIASSASSLIAFDAETGAERWRSPQPISGTSPLIWNGMVYLSTWGEGLKALDAATGEEVWQYLTGVSPVPDSIPPDSFDSSPTIADGTLYIGEGANGGLFALDPATGEER